MRPRRWLWLLPALCLPAAAYGAAWPVPVRSFQLPNGLSVLMAPDSQMTTVDLAVWYPAGSRYERTGQSGLTHLFDGLMFGGSRSYPAGEHQRLLLAEGATSNIFTSPDYSCFYETLPPQALDLALALEADRMGYLTLTQRTLGAAKAGLKQQREGSAEGSPLGRSFQKLFATAFTGHPYRWPVSGLPADVERITLQDCVTYYRDHYGPRGALLTLVGRLDPAAAEAAVRRHFGGIARRGLPIVSPPAPVPQARRASGAVEFQVPLLLAGWRTPPDTDPDVPALDLLGRVISRGSRSRLTRGLTGPEGIALLARGDYDRRAQGGLLYALIATRPGADSAETERRLVSEIEKLGEEPVTAEELDQARHQAEVDEYTNWQTSRGLAQAIGNAQMLDRDWRAAQQRLDRLRDLTPEDLRKAAARSLVAANRTVVWMQTLAPGSAGANFGTPPRSGGAKKGGR